MLTREQILQDTIELLLEHREDLDLQVNKITAETKFLEDLGVESLEVVVIAMATQQRYNQIFPFNDYFTELGEREDNDLTLGEWVDFLYSHLNSTVSNCPQTTPEVSTVAAENKPLS